MTNLLTSNSILSSIAGSAVVTKVVTKILSSPLLMKATIGGAALTAAGFTLTKLSHTKKGIALRKKLITGIRNNADKAIKNLDMAARELEDVVAGAKKKTLNHAAKARVKVKTAKA